MTGPRTGSRVSRLLALKPGERIFFEAPEGRLAPFMQQIQVDIRRSNLSGLVAQSLVLGIEVSTRCVIELVMVTRSDE